MMDIFAIQVRGKWYLMAQIMIAILILQSVLVQSQVGAPSRRFFVEPTMPYDPGGLRQVLIASTDGDEKKDTLYLVLSDRELPIAYYQKINRSVCFDDKCRLLKVNLYWNITGRYLGFELPVGEFLSKSDHIPFGVEEYQELAKILSDSLSPLAQFSYAEMMPRKLTVEGIDAVTSPTPKNVSSHVVKGAAYTTYTMWHSVYSNIRDTISVLTSKYLTSNLLLAIMRSPNRFDQNWALQHLGSLKMYSPELSSLVVSFVNDQNYNLAMVALKSVPVDMLSETQFQNGLFSAFKNAGYGLKNSIVMQLMQATTIHLKFKTGLTDFLPEARGALLVNILKLFEKHSVDDMAAVGAVLKLLLEDNDFVKKQAYLFLKNVRDPENRLKPYLDEYQSKSEKE